MSETKLNNINLKNQPEDFCYKCKNPMAEITMGGMVNRRLVVTKTFVCIDDKCDRFGLLSVVGYKLTPKTGGEKIDHISRPETKKSN